MPAVSVIMPVYNISESYLRHAIESVLSQTFTDFELIIVNDGSTNNAAEIIAEYQNKDARIKVITQQNQGLSAARNSALEKATGQNIAFIDSDDYYADNFLAELIKAKEATQAEISGCDFQKILHDDENIATVQHTTPCCYDNALNTLLHRKNFIHFNVWNKLYDRSVIGDTRFIHGIYYEDWVFNCCVFAKAKRFCWIKEKLYAYRMSNNSIMRSDYNEKKLQDYVTGIKAVYDYFKANAPEKWHHVRKSCISRIVKMMMNSSLRSQNNTLTAKTAEVLQKLHNDNLICYSGLSIANKLKLFKFLY